MSDIVVRIIDMDPRVKGFVKESPDGFYNIYINSCLCHEAQVETYQHELEHIERDHLSSCRGVMDLEDEAKGGH